MDIPTIAQHLLETLIANKWTWSNDVPHHYRPQLEALGLMRATYDLPRDTGGRFLYGQRPMYVWTTEGFEALRLTRRKLVMQHNEAVRRFKAQTAA